MRELLKAALKKEPSDLLLKGGRIANVFTMEYEMADIAVKDGIIVGIGKGFEAHEEVNCSDRTLVPGFIEGHMHVESTMMVPRNLAAELSPLGTTTIMADPHEIANTCGMEGVLFMRRESDGLPIDIYYGAPSCVPASFYETAREPLGVESIKTLFESEICTHLGEMMNFPGVFLGDPEVWAKLETARHKVITGHAPGLKDEELAGYIMGGVTSDHECMSEAEALEKLRRGMYIMIRQGATARNLTALAPILRHNHTLAPRCMAVSDDISPDFIHARGHLNGCIKELIAEGVNPLVALRMVTLSPAEYFRLDDRGAIAPGRIADIVMIDSLDDCSVLKVWKRGKLVAEYGKTLKQLVPAVISDLPGIQASIRTPSADKLKLPLPPEINKINVIGTIRGEVNTIRLEVTPSVRDGLVVADGERGLTKLVVVEKNRGTGRMAIGFLKDFGLSKGAIASSIAHDAHNFICAGMDDISMATALRALAEIGGGVIITLGDLVLAQLELPVGGLMSLLPAEELRARIKPLAEAREVLGCTNPDVLMQLSFLSLSVIPELKLTDQGYFDITAGGPQPLFLN